MSGTIDVIETLAAEVDAMYEGLVELRNQNKLLNDRVRELERKVFNLPEHSAVGRSRCCG